MEHNELVDYVSDLADQAETLNEALQDLLRELKKKKKGD